MRNSETKSANKISGANAGGLRLLPIWARTAARIAQFRRSLKGKT